MKSNSLPLHKRISRKVRDIRLGARIWRGARARSRKTDTRYIAVTGSAAKSSTVSLLGHILTGTSQGHTQVFNNTIASIARSLYRQSPDMKWAVKEIGMSGRNTIAPMARLVRPHYAIVTMVGLDHYKHHRSREAISQEKGALLEALEPGGTTILNADDPHVMSMRSRTGERVVTFGRAVTSDYQVTDVAAGLADLLTLTLRTPRGDLAIAARFTGEHFWLPVAAAAACAIEMGTDPDVVVSRIADFEPRWDRCYPLDIPDGPTFLIDTVKAPVYSLGLAFATLKGARGNRRIVIGQLADHPGNSKTAARKARRLAEPYADELIFVGHSQKRLGLTEAELANGRYSIFETVEQASQYIKTTATPDDVIMLKSSGAIHMERIALEWTSNVRCWKDRCGKGMTPCLDCGRHGLSYAAHRGMLRKEICKLIADRLDARQQSGK